MNLEFEYNNWQNEQLEKDARPYVWILLDEPWRHHCSSGKDASEKGTAKCGSIDIIFESPDDTLQIYDWKRVKSIGYEALGNKTSIIPSLKQIPDTNFWHYALQLNLYKMILEE